MTNVFISVEGQTESVVVTQLLQPHLEAYGVWLTPFIVRTSSPHSGPAFRGGVSDWSKLRREIDNLLQSRGVALVTTMYDLHAFPSDAPGMADRPSGGHGAAAQVQAAMKEHFGTDRFDPYLSVHELEALVIAVPHEVLEDQARGRGAQLKPLRKLGPPEEVDHDRPPSHRILECWPDYAKPLDGPAVLSRAGLDAIRERCPHFDAWVTRLEGLASTDASDYGP